MARGEVRQCRDSCGESQRRCTTAFTRAAIMKRIERVWQEDLRLLRIAYRELFDACPRGESQKGAPGRGLVEWRYLREKGVSESVVLFMLYHIHVEIFKMGRGSRGGRDIWARIETLLIDDAKAI